jgi:hypothetical protein
MKRPQCGKVYNILPPKAIVDNAAFVFVGSNGTNDNGIDTAGFSWARFRIQMGATDIAMAVLPKVIESDAIALTSPADVAGAAVAAISATDDNKIYQIDVPLDGRKRYLQLAATGGDGSTGQFMAATCELFGMVNDPITAAGYNLGGMTMPT